MPSGLIKGCQVTLSMLNVRFQRTLLVILYIELCSTPFLILLLRVMYPVDRLSSELQTLLLSCTIMNYFYNIGGLTRCFSYKLTVVV
jgi:hypothetical protein